mmetsp:Transcript_41769/g.126717  ORF Transcript_41769/g.126717 Transcript_41769/m.126717 type:complete len:178 (-) Transcript_41769:65-598(-)
MVWVQKGQSCFGPKKRDSTTNGLRRTPSQQYQGNQSCCVHKKRFKHESMIPLASLPCYGRERARGSDAGMQGSRLTEANEQNGINRAPSRARHHGGERAGGIHQFEAQMRGLAVVHALRCVALQPALSLSFLSPGVGRKNPFAAHWTLKAKPSQAEPRATRSLAGRKSSGRELEGER